MKAQDEKEKAFLRVELLDILTNCPDDMAYLKRLIFAREIIDETIDAFSYDEYMNVTMELMEEGNEE